MAADGLRGQVAIVTGAGGGIGRAEALTLAARGCHVVVNDSDADLAAAVAAEITAAHGFAVAVAAPASTVEGGEAVTATAMDTFGTVDILVNNAGLQRPAAFEDLTPRQIADAIDVHLLAGVAVMSAQMRRIPGIHPAAVYAQLAAGAFGCLTFLAPGLIFEVAAFRPERDPSQTQLLNAHGLDLHGDAVDALPDAELDFRLRDPV